MLERWTRTLGVVIGARTLSLVLLRGFRQAEPQLLLQRELEAGCSTDALRDVLEQSLQTIDLHRVRARVVLSEPWVRFWRVEPPVNTWRWRDFDAMARMRFQQVFEESPDAWHIEFDARANDPFLACGMENTLLTVLQRAFVAQRITLVSLQPELTLLWNHWREHLSANNWLGVWSAGNLNVAMVHAGRLVGWRQLGELTGESIGRPIQVLQREVLRLGVEMPEELAICGSIPLNMNLGLGYRALGSQNSALSVWGLAS